jgi:hypothetical protein
VSFDLLNAADVTFPRQAGWYACDIAAMVNNASRGDGVLSGCAVTPQGTPDTTVAVAAGLVKCNGFFSYVVAGNVTGFAAHASLDRIDLVCVDWNGVLSRVAGTAAAKPVPPSLPANSLILAQVFVPGASASVGTNNLKDRRIIILDLFDYQEDFFASSLSATAATGQGSYGAEFGFSLAASGTLAAPTSQANAANNPGILRTSTGATSGNNTQMGLNANVPAGKIIRTRFVVAIPTITTMAAKFGLGQSLNDAASASLGTDGAFWEFVPATSANWACVTRAASTSTRNATGTAVTAGNNYQLDILRKQNGNYQFGLNGALSFEHSTNLPAAGASVTPGTLTHTLTTAARNVDHDYIGINMAPSWQRWT